MSVKRYNLHKCRIVRGEQGGGNYWEPCLLMVGRDEGGWEVAEHFFFFIEIRLYFQATYIC